MKVAVICDTHFGVRNDNVSFLDHQEKFYNEVFFPEIDRLGIKTILDLGDTFDRRKYVNYATLKRVYNMWFDPIKDRGITYHCILGNHTTYYKNTNEINFGMLVEKYDNVNVYEREPVEIDLEGTTVMLSPWICAENKQSSFDAFRETKAQILMGHFEIQGFEMMKGHLCDHGLDMKTFDRFDSVYSGHFHHPSSYGNITYLGAPYEMTWTDFGGKRGFHIFDTDNRTMTFVENPYRMFHKLVYDDTDMTIEDITHLNTEGLTNTYVKVIVRSKANPYIFDLFLDKLQNSGAVDIKVVEDHMNLDSINEEELLDEAQDTLTILRQFVEGLEIKHDKSRVDRLLRELYQEANAL